MNPVWTVALIGNGFFSISHVGSLAQPNFGSSPSTMMHLLIGLDMDLMACTSTQSNTLSHASPHGFLKQNMRGYSVISVP